MRQLEGLVYTCLDSDMQDRSIFGTYGRRYRDLGIWD